MLEVTATRHTSIRVTCSAHRATATAEGASTSAKTALLLRRTSRPTLETEPLHFQLPPTKNFRPDIRAALEANPRAAAGARAPAKSAAENMLY